MYISGPTPAVSLLVPPLATGLAMAALAYYVWRRRAAPGASALTGALACISVWCITYGMEMSASTLAGKMLWCRFESPAITSVPVCCLLLSIHYCGYRLGRSTTAALFLVPLATQGMHWTNPWFHLYWKSIWVDASGPVPLLARIYGPGFWVFVSYSYICTMVGVILLIRHLLRPGSRERRATIFFVLAVLLPFTANILYVFDLEPVKYLDITPFAFAATGVCLTWILFHYRFQGIVPVAWSTVVDNMPDGVIVLDKLGRIMEANPAAERLLGLVTGELIGRDPEIAFRHRPEFLPLTKSWNRSEQEVAFADGGGERFCRAEIQPLRSRRGRRIGRVLSIRDVTAERKAARELEESRRAAEAAALAKSRFLANMSHEIRTPMNGILGMAALLDQSRLLPEDAECAEAIRTSAESLLRILNDILDFSKIEAGRLELESIDFDLRTVLNDVVRLMEISAQAKELSVSLRWAPDMPRYFTGDPGRLRQVLLNLVGNAVKFTHQGGVTVESRCLERDADAARLEISVSDTGIGIAGEQLHLLFHEFSQADASIARQHGGTGLGLAISKRLIAFMGGTVTVRSRLGEGTTFCIQVRLPLAQRAVAPALADPGSSPRFDGCRVLLAEDNPVNQRVGVRILEKAGCRVDLAANGAEALRLAEASAYDIVFMDCQMPVMDGLEATAAIRKRGLKTPVIALTASALEETRQACLSAGMDDFASKPINQGTWLEVLDKWVGHGNRVAD